MKRDLNNSIVKKKWGEEYLVYRNQHLAMWLLKIDHQQQTSLHCHCEKETGLIVLDGVAKVSFLNNSTILKGLDKIQIFKKRFHSTKSLSKNGTYVLEIEHPEDKKDLIRFEDSYGREDLPYESDENYIDKREDCLNIEEGKEIFKYNCNFSIENITDKNQLINRDFEDIAVILDGGIQCVDGRFLTSIGDVIAFHNFDILLKKFSIAENTKILSIKKV
jgi:hypothetical protein